jgi:hypothetical protein
MKFQKTRGFGYVINKSYANAKQGFYVDANGSEQRGCAFKNKRGLGFKNKRGLGFKNKRGFAYT